MLRRITRKMVAWETTNSNRESDYTHICWEQSPTSGEMEKEANDVYACQADVDRVEPLPPGPSALYGAGGCFSCLTLKSERRWA